MTLWVLGGDARSRFTAEFFRKNGFAVETHGVPQLTDSPLPQKLQYAILPFPSFAGALLRGQSALPAEEILARSDSQTTVFGGQFSSWREPFLSRGAKVCDLYGSEPLTTSNAIPTAEGAICLAIEHSPITLHGSNCLVVGYGRCGKILAHKLHALGANVTVGARRDADFAFAEAMGLQTDKSGIWQHGLHAYDFIFNTVPTSVFSPEQLSTLSADCVIIELASKPGGIPETEQRNLHYHFAPGLPGKFSAKTAGILYARSILSIIESECIH